MTSCVPRGRSMFVVIRSLRELGAKLRKEWIAGELGGQRRRWAMAGVDRRLRRERVHELPDRRHELVPASTRQIRPSDRAREEDVAGEEAAVGVEGEVW